jgi:hypothetical protein
MKISGAVHDGMMAACCLALLGGCAGNGDGLDANGRPLGDATGSVTLSADFQSIQDNVFTPICSVCHVGGSAPMGLRLDAANAYNLLVGVPSTEVPSILRVKPGDPDNSYIIQKLEGHASVGARMPFGGPYLSTDTVAFIRQWISNGAPPSSSAPAPAEEHFTLNNVVPDGSESLSVSPPQIVLAFNRDLDASQVAAGSARITKLDAGTGRAIEVSPARLSQPNGNARALMIWPLQGLGAGRYQVSIQTALPPGVADLNGHMAAPGWMTAEGSYVVSTFDVEVLP